MVATVNGLEADSCSFFAIIGSEDSIHVPPRAARAGVETRARMVAPNAIGLQNQPELAPAAWRLRLVAPGRSIDTPYGG